MNSRPASVLMVMGTCSSAGKSLVVTALCRSLARRGLRVAPFKSQNMSNNAAVCPSGGEIGRSQALQARAAGVIPHTDMNPVLLKPEGDTRSQVIVNGVATPALEARAYFRQKERLWPVVTAALDRLRAEHDVVVIEGAGSPAELNLSRVEIVNLAVARYCQAPVILVGDIERGGVFAQLLGTLWLISDSDRDLFCGLLVNKFRGDRSLFDEGVEILQQRSGKPVLGVLPWVSDLHLPEEDAVALGEESSANNGIAGSTPADRLDVVVVNLPHIANFDDFDPLAEEPGVCLRYARTAAEIGLPQVLMLPGTKNTIGDLHWLRESGIAGRIAELVSQGVQVVGICGGYQMLGRVIENPDQLECDERRAAGLGLLDVVTSYHSSKRTRQIRFRITNDLTAPGTLGECVQGYEIHVGRTQSRHSWLEAFPDADRLSALPEHEQHDNGPDGTDGGYAREGQVWGCYLHGLFANDSFRRAFLVKQGVAPEMLLEEPAGTRLEQSLDRLADALEESVDVSSLLENVIQSQSQNKESASHV